MTAGADEGRGEVRGVRVSSTAALVGRRDSRGTRWAGLIVPTGGNAAALGPSVEGARGKRRGGRAGMHEVPCLDSRVRGPGGLRLKGGLWGRRVGRARGRGPDRVPFVTRTRTASRGTGISMQVSWVTGTGNAVMVVMALASTWAAERGPGIISGAARVRLGRRHIVT